MDTGSQVVGLAAVANEEVLLQAEVHLRTDIKQKLDQRRKSSTHPAEPKDEIPPGAFCELSPESRVAAALPARISGGNAGSRPLGGDRVARPTGQRGDRKL